MSIPQMKQEQQEQTQTRIQSQSQVQERRQQDMLQALQQMPEQQIDRHALIPGAMTMHVQAKDTLRMEALQGRCIAKLLLDQNTGKDSDAMKNAKDSVSELERLLEQSPEQKNIVSYLDSLDAAYLAAISHCRYYCEHRNPSFETGIQRKKAVSDELESLLREKAQMDVARQLVKDGKFDITDKNGRDLLDAAQKTMSQPAGQAEAQQPVQEDPMQKLSFADFARMLGTHNRGQIEFDGKGLQMINNGKFSMSKGVASERNYDLAQYFKSLVTQELERAQVPVDEILKQQNRIAHLLGLSEGQSAILPISREAVAEIVRTVNDYTSVVDQTLRKGRAALPEDFSLARRIDERLSANAPDEHETRTQEEHEQILRSQVTDIMKSAKAQGIRLPELSKHQMDNLVKGNINRVRTEAFQYMHNIFERMCNMNGGRIMEFSRLAGDEKLLNRIMALTIAKISAVSDAGVDVAEHELSVQITEAAFQYGDEKNKLREAYDKSDVRMFSMQGDDGLEACVERTYPRVKEWNVAQVRVKKGMDGLADLSRSLKSLHDMREKAFGEGLTPEEADELRTLGTHIQNLITGQEQNAPSMEDMEFVSKQLNGTRYQEGFEYVKQLKKDFSFAAAAEQIAAATTYRKADAEEQKLRESYGERDQKPDDIAQPQQTVETEQLLGKLGGQERSVAEILLMTKRPSGLIKENGDVISRDLVKLRFALSSFTGGVAHTESLTVAGVNVRLTQKQSGAFEMQIGKQKIRTPYSPELIVAKMDADISMNVDAYGDQATGDVLSDAISSVEENLGEQKTLMNRTLFVNVLCQKTNLPASKFNNVSPTKLAEMTRHLLTGSMTVTDVTAELQRLSQEKMNQLNEQDTLDMLRILEEKEKLKQEKKVTFRPQEEEKKEEKPDEAKWTKEEEELKDFVADLIFSKETWKTDTDRSTPVERMKALIRPHSYLLAKIIYNPKILDDMLDKLYMPGAEDLTATLKEKIHGVFQGGMFQELKERCGNAFFGPAVLQGCLRVALGHEQPSEQLLKQLKAEKEWPKIMKQLEEQLTTLDQTIEEQVKTQINTIQESITEAVDTVFTAKEDQKEEVDDNVGPEIPKLSVELENAAKGKQGQGKFMRIVLSNYFKDADLIDQRAMLAGAIRDLKPVNAKSVETMDDKAKEKHMGHFLGGFLKGAGPLMHKMLQGLPTESMPETLKSAVGDMKSNLSPIPQRIVEARLNKLIDNSHGSITKIEVTRSMGAASVGQVFLCKMFGPGMAEDGKDVVIKLLRPDVSNHMEREKRHMLTYAGKTDEQGGMLATYKGQLERIEEELDLRIEARNVKRGEVYDKGSKTVQAVKLVDLVEPDVNTLVMEKAPGTTVDKYLKEAEEERKRLWDELDTADDGGYETLQKLDRMLDDLMKRQKYLTEAAQKWILSGLYNEGFYHGDLHAGNIMVSDEGATIVDFGNATQITEEQREHIMHMLCTASIGDAKKFRHHFHMLMSQGSEEAYQKHRKEFGEILEDVLNREDMTHAGERIAVALLKAQELGLELPGAVFNFSQCQLRLQNTISDMNQMISRVTNNISLLLMKRKPENGHRSLIGKWKADINQFLDDRLKDQPMGKSLEEIIKTEMNKTGNLRLKRPKMVSDLLNDEGSSADFSIVMDLNTLKQLQEQLKVPGNEKMKAANAVAVCIDLMKALRMACSEQEQDVLGALDVLEKKLIDAFKSQDTAQIDEAMNELMTCKKGSLTDAYLASRDQYKKAKEQAVSEEELKKVEEQAVEATLRMSECLAPKTTKNLAGVWSGLMLKLHAEDQTAFQQEMKSWFEDKECFGEQLQEAYHKYLEARKAGPTEERDQAEDNLFDIMNQAIPRRAEYFYQMYTKQCNLGKREDFFDTMGSVITEKRKETISKLGLFSSFSYRKIREGKNLKQISPVQAAWDRRKEARDVIDDIEMECMNKPDRILRGLNLDHKTDPQTAQSLFMNWDQIRETLTEGDDTVAAEIYRKQEKWPQYITESMAERWISLLERAGREENPALIQQALNDMRRLIADIKRKTGYKSISDMVAEREQAQNNQPGNEPNNQQ